MLMISYRGIGVSQRSYQDTSSEVGVTSVITPLPSGEGKGEGPLTNMGNLGDHAPPFGGGEGGGAANQ